MKMKEFKVGDSVTVVANTAGHNVPYGTKLTIKAMVDQNTYSVKENTMNYYTVDLKLNHAEISTLKKRLTELDAQISELVKQQAQIQDQIIWAERNNLIVFNPEQYRVYQALQAIKNTDDLVEVSQVIANLMQ